MPEDGNGKNSLPVPVESVDFTITIHHNIVSGAFELDGAGKNLLVTIGMLEYALVIVKRADAKQTMLREIANSPRLVSPRGLV